MTVQNCPKGTSIDHLHRFCHLMIGQLPAARIEPDAWPALVDLAFEHDLAPFLAWRLNADPGTIPQSLRERLNAAYREAVTRYLIVQRAQHAIAQALEQADIPHMWLKGMALAETVYPDAALRPMGDLDVLVDGAQRQAALACLRQIGYDFYQPAAVYDPNDLAAQGQIHHYLLRGGAGDSVMVELHFRLMGTHTWDVRQDPPEQWLRQQAIRYTVNNRTLIAPKVEAHLLYLCAHIALQHGLDEFVLSRFLDLHLLIMSQPLDWSAIVQQAAARRWTYAVEQSLRRTQDLFGTTLPDQVYADLQRRRPADENIGLVDSLAGPAAGFAVFKGSLDRLTWREKAQWIWRVLFPTPAYMRTRYHLAPGQAVWPFYGKRWFNQLRDLLTWLRLQASRR